MGRRAVSPAGVTKVRNASWARSTITGAEGIGMRRVIRVLLVPAALLALAGCGSAVKNVIASVSASHSISLPTDQPTTAPPTPVASPTVQPTTPVPTTPVATTPAATTAAPSPTSTGTGSTSTPAWLWLILALVVIAGLTFILIARAASKRKAVTGQWRSAVTDVYARGSALHDAMASVEWPSGTAPDQAQGEAQARWADIQNRADDLAQTLYRMRETAPDEDSRIRVDDVLGSLQAVRTAMNAERAPGAGPAQNEMSRSRLYSFARSLRALRGDEPAGPGMP
jgi:hypothetical protein